jgi:hypothetical protein
VEDAVGVLVSIVCRQSILFYRSLLLKCIANRRSVAEPFVLIAWGLFQFCDDPIATLVLDPALSESNFENRA